MGTNKGPEAAGATHAARRRASGRWKEKSGHTLEGAKRCSVRTFPVGVSRENSFAVGRLCWLVQQWAPCTRFVLLDKPAVALILSAAKELERGRPARSQPRPHFRPSANDAKPTEPH